MANDILDDLMTADQSITLENPITQSTTTENAVTTLSQEELGKAKELSKSLDENNSQSVIEYGSLAQKKIGDFSPESIKPKTKGSIILFLSDLDSDLLTVSPACIISEALYTVCLSNALSITFEVCWQATTTFKPLLSISARLEAN